MLHFSDKLTDDFSCFTFIYNVAICGVEPKILPQLNPHMLLCWDYLSKRLWLWLKKNSMYTLYAIMSKLKVSYWKIHFSHFPKFKSSTQLLCLCSTKIVIVLVLGKGIGYFRHWTSTIVVAVLFLVRSYVGSTFYPFWKKKHKGWLQVAIP